MVARGDLGIECPLEELPVIQRRAVKTCFHHGRPVIIATHMLESMIGSPMPTRAEITDVANAVYERADCFMLSGETAVGRYPFEGVAVLDKITRRIERETPADFVPPAHLQGDKLRLLQSAVQFANQLQGSALLTFTRQGFMATNLAAMRPAFAPIFAFTHSVETLRQLRLLRATEPFLISLASEPNETIERAIAILRRDGRIQPGDRMVIRTPTRSYTSNYG